MGNRTFSNILLIGGTSDIGLALVRELLHQDNKEPKRVHLVSRSDVSMSAAQSSLNGNANMHLTRSGKVDFREPTKISIQIGNILGSEEFDLIIISVATIPSITPNLIDLISINFVSPAVVLDLILESQLNRDCQVVLLSSALIGLRPRDNSFIYTASKLGLDFFARGLQKIAFKKNQLIIVRPGFVRTKLTKMSKSGRFPQSPDELAKMIVPRIGKTKIFFAPRFLQPLVMILNALPERIYRKLP